MKKRNENKNKANRHEMESRAEWMVAAAKGGGGGGGGEEANDLHPDASVTKGAIKGQRQGGAYCTARQSC